MRKLIVTLMVMAIGGVASANLLTNGGFEDSFSAGYGTSYDGTANSKAYVGQPASDLSGWSADNWGYVWNPTGTGGINDWWGTDEGLTSVSEGNGAAGSNGSVGHMLNIWQYTGQVLAEGETITLNFDINSVLDDYGANAWMNVHVQFVGTAEPAVSYVYNATTSPNGVSQDVWTGQTLETVVTAAQAGGVLQVHVNGAGVWIDDMDLTVIPEPGTLGMFALLGGGILWIRKTFMI